MKLEPFFPGSNDFLFHYFLCFYLNMLTYSLLGCGGYVYEKGVVFSPNNLSHVDNVTECVWFVEAEQGETGIILKRNRITNITAGNDEQDQPIMKVNILF